MSEKTVLEITDDPTSIKTIINEMVTALQSPGAKKSREMSLVVTKLQEAVMWLERDQALS